MAHCAVWRSRIWAMVLLVLLAAASGASAQSTASTIEGTVLDASGGAVVGAAIVVRNEATGQTQALVTDAAGHYSLPALAAGTYAVEVTQSGFAQQRREKLTLLAGQTLTVDLKLGLATMTEEVNVSGKIPAAAQTAPSQGSLTARSAQSIIGQDFIDKFTSPVAAGSIRRCAGRWATRPGGAGRPRKLRARSAGAQRALGPPDEGPRRSLPGAILSRRRLRQGWRPRERAA